MRIYDISVPITHRTPVFPGDPAINIRAAKRITDGDGANVTHLDFGAHTATHVDAPAHFIDGAGKVADLSLDTLVGEALVIEIPDEADAVTAAHVSAETVRGAVRVLFKTRNSAFWRSDPHRFREDFTYIDSDAARSLVEQGVKLVGIDYLSVESLTAVEAATHVTLLSASVIIVEGLDLSLVPAGRYELICLPLRLAEATGDGAPARVILRTIDAETAGAA